MNTQLIINQIIEIQKAAFKIQDAGLLIKPTFFKEPVSLEILKDLSKHYTIPIVEECKIQGTKTYIKIRTESSDIIVQLKK